MIISWLIHSFTNCHNNYYGYPCTLHVHYITWNGKEFWQKYPGIVMPGWKFRSSFLYIFYGKKPHKVPVSLNMVLS